MISVRFFLKEGYPVSCELKDGENVFFGGVTAQGEFFCEKGVPYPEMMLRALDIFMSPLAGSPTKKYPSLTL